MDTDEIDLRNPPNCVSYKGPTKTKPAGYRVEVWLRDQWDERRKKSKTIRADDDTDEALYDALDKAIAWRDRVEEKKTDIRWLRKEFPEPAEKEVYHGLDSLADRVEKFEPDDSEDTLQDFVERGMKRGKSGKVVQDPRSTEMGFLRRVHVDTSSGNFDFLEWVWRAIIVDGYGEAHKLTLDEIDGTVVDDFVRWCEAEIDDGEPRFAKSSILNYRSRLRSMISRFAVDQKEMNPLEISPSRRDPRLIQGKSKRRKKPTEDEMTVLDEGFRRRVEEAADRYRPTRELCREVYLLLRYTGLRPSEAFFLEPDHVDTIRNRIKVEGALTKKDGRGQTKSAKLGADDGERVVPVADHVVEGITDWIERREDLGFPSLADQPLIYCQSTGDPLHKDILRDHFYKAFEAYQGPLNPEKKVAPYFVRHWRNDQLRRRGCPPEIRAEIIGNDVEINKSHYSHVDAEEARDYLEND